MLQGTSWVQERSYKVSVSHSYAYIHVQNLASNHSEGAMQCTYIFF